MDGKARVCLSEVSTAGQEEEASTAAGSKAARKRSRSPRHPLFLRLRFWTSLPLTEYM